MAHPIANHPILSKVAPDLVEQVLAHTTATLVVPEGQRQETADLTRSVLKEKLLSQGLSDELSTSYADAARAAVDANIESLEALAKLNGMSIEQLLFISMQIKCDNVEHFKRALIQGLMTKHRVGNADNSRYRTNRREQQLAFTVQ